MLAELRTNIHHVSKTHENVFQSKEFCIKNEELCTKSHELCSSFWKAHISAGRSKPPGQFSIEEWRFVPDLNNGFVFL